MGEKDDFCLLDGEVKKIINNVLEEDSKIFRQELFVRLSEDVEKRYRESSDMSMKELRDYLEEQVITEAREAFTNWRSIEDEKLAKTFESSCKRFITKIDDTANSLLKFSAELFAVPFDIVKAEAIWSTKSSFYYRFQEQPVGIEIVTSSLTMLLSKFIGEKIISNKVNEYLQRVIDLHAANAGNDFESRLDRSKLMFRWEMFQRIDATLEGISKAIEKGMNLKSKGERAVDEQKSIPLKQQENGRNQRKTDSEPAEGLFISA